MSVGNGFERSVLGSAYGDGAGRGVSPAMGDGQEDVANAQALSPCAGGPAQV